MRTTVQHPMTIQVQKLYVQQVIRDYTSIMHAAIDVAVLVDEDYGNILFYNGELRYPMESDDGEYCGFDKDVYVTEVVDCTSLETQADTYDQYIGSELQITNKYVIKRMERFHQRLHDPDGNPEGIGNYRLWADYTEY